MRRNILIIVIAVWVNALMSTAAWAVHVANEPNNGVVWVMAIVAVLASSFMFALIPTFREIEKLNENGF